MTAHTLTQEPDTQGYGDGLESWTCSCGATFSGTDIQEAFDHGMEAADPPLVLTVVEGGIARTLVHGEAETHILDWDEVNGGPLDYIEETIRMVEALPAGFPHDRDRLLATLRRRGAAHARITLNDLRKALRSESISYGELAELQSLAPWIEPGDVELAEPAGIPESVFAAHSADPRPVTYTDAEIEAARAEENHVYTDAEIAERTCNGHLPGEPCR